MKSIILYESKTGCTKKCASYINENNKSKMERISEFKEDISSYESIVVMGPIYMGKIHNMVVSFLKENEEILLTKNIHIVLCGMNSEGFNTTVKNNISETLINHADIIHGGGAYYLEKLGFIQKRIVKAVAKVTTSSEHIKYDNLDKIKI